MQSNLDGHISIYKCNPNIRTFLIYSIPVTLIQISEDTVPKDAN